MIKKMRKTLLMLPALLMLCSCVGNKAKDVAKTDAAADEVRSGSVGLDGKWKLCTYRVDCESIEFVDESPYAITFDEAENSFGISTDCNTIGGMFAVINDTIRFRNVMVTEMACDEEQVEKDMLRLMNDSDSYALCTGDTVVFTAPSNGSALFARVK